MQDASEKTRPGCFAFAHGRMGLTRLCRGGSRRIAPPFSKGVWASTLDEGAAATLTGEYMHVHARVLGNGYLAALSRHSVLVQGARTPLTYKEAVQ